MGRGFGGGDCKSFKRIALKRHPFIIDYSIPYNYSLSSTEVTFWHFYGNWYIMALYFQ